MFTVDVKQQYNNNNNYAESYGLKILIKALPQQSIHWQDSREEAFCPYISEHIVFENSQQTVEPNSLGVNSPCMMQEIL